MQIASAQTTNKISGTVSDAAGEPLIGVSIRVIGGNQGAVSDIEGKFSLDANPNSSIEIRYMGYKSQTIKVGQQTTFQIVLDEDLNALEEVVVIGYGVARKKDLTGASASIKGQTLPMSLSLLPPRLLRVEWQG
ncbi:MAG: carboxypeptidase-like regulatory domain-containing protein [Leadbetterella sp.]|nr:carboxypeptidase-like regulatory domain-containing protein [Leadbetterella sp.]